MSPGDTHEVAVGEKNKKTEEVAEPQKGTPEWEILERVKKSRSKSGIEETSLLIRSLITDEYGERRPSDSRDKPFVRAGKYDENFQETKYLSSQQEALMVHAKLVHFAKAQEREFIKAHEQYSLAVAKEIMGRQRLYSTVNAGKIPPLERAKLQKELTPAAAEEDLRTTVILYEEGMIHRIWKTEEDIARYWAANPTLRERLAKTVPQRYAEIQAEEARLKSMHEELDQLLTATTALSEIWYFQTMLDEDRIATLIREFPQDLDRKIVQEQGGDRPYTLLDLAKDKTHASAAQAALNVLPASLHSTGIAELRSGFRTVPEMVQDAEIKLTSRELQGYVHLLRELAVQRKLLDQAQQNASSADLASKCDALEEQKRAVLRTGEEWYLPSGKPGKQKVQLATRLFTDITTAHVETSVQEVIRNGNDVSQDEILHSLKVGIGENIASQRFNARFSGRLLELMVERKHFGAGSRPGGTLLPLHQREIQEVKAAVIPEPLRSQVLQEFERYTVGFEDYIAALNEVTAEQTSIRERLREGTLGLIDHAVDLVQQAIVDLEENRIFWYIPYHTGIGKFNLEEAVRAAASAGGAKWPGATRLENLHRLQKRLAEQRMEVAAPIEKYASSDTAKRIATDLKNLRGLLDIATPEELKNREAAFKNLRLALTEKPPNEAKIRACAKIHRETWNAMGARPEGMALVGGDPIIPKGEVNVSALSKSYIAAKQRVETLERAAASIRDKNASKAQAELPAALEELRHIQLTIQGAHEKVLTQLNGEHIPAIDQQTEELFLALLEKFDRHAAEIARYDYLKYVPWSVAFGFVTSAAEVAAAGYYLSGYVPSPLPTAPGARMFRKGVNWLPKKVVQTGAGFVKEKIAAVIARLQRPRVVPSVTPKTSVPSQVPLEQLEKDIANAVNTIDQSPPASLTNAAAAEAQAMEKATSMARLNRFVGSGLIGVDALAQAIVVYQNHQQILAAEKRGDEDTAMILRSKEKTTVASGALSVASGALSLSEALSGIAWPAAIALGTFTVSNDLLYGIALDLNQSEVAKNVLRPSEELLADLERLGGQSRMRDSFTLGPEARRNQRENALQAYLLKHTPVVLTEQALDVGNAWFEGLEPEEKLIQIQKHTTSKDAIKYHVMDVTLRPHLSKGVNRGMDYLDFSTRSRLHPKEKTFDIPVDRHRVDLLSRAQSVASIYALRSQLLAEHADTKLRYFPKPGKEEVLDLAALPDTLPTMRTTFTERTMAQFDEAVRQYQDYELWKMRKDFIKYGSGEEGGERLKRGVNPAKDALIWKKAAEDIRPAVYRRLAPAIALAEVNVRKISNDVDRDATLWDLRCIVQDYADRILNKINDETVTDLQDIQLEFSVASLELAKLQWTQIIARSEVTDRSSPRYNDLRAALHPKSLVVRYNSSTDLEHERTAQKETEASMKAKTGGVPLSDCVRVLIDH